MLVDKVKILLAKSTQTIQIKVLFMQRKTFIENKY